MKNDELPILVSIVQLLIFAFLVLVAITLNMLIPRGDAPFVFFSLMLYPVSWLCGPVQYLRWCGMRSDWVKFHVMKDIMAVFSIVVVLLLLELHLPLHWYIVLVILFLVLEIPLARRILKLFHPNSV